MTFVILQEPKRTLTAIAADTILPGYLVKAMSIADVATTVAWEGGIVVECCSAAADTATCVGIAIGSAVSGDKVTIATDGFYSIPAAYACAPGQEVGTGGDVDPLCVRAASYTCTGSTSALQYIKAIGTAWSSAASGEQVIFNLNL